MATAIRRRKLYEDVADHLDQLIQDGAYAPSDLLSSERSHEAFWRWPASRLGGAIPFL